MEELFQEITSTAQDIAGKISPIFTWVSEKIASFIDVAPDNVHTFLLILISLWLSAKFTRERGFKFIIIAVVLFLLFRWLQL